MSPKHSIDFCPICGGGLCGVRVCGLTTPGPSSDHRSASKNGNGENDDNLADAAETDARRHPHGLIVCDECEAIWLEPDTSTDHVYPKAEDAACPICAQSLYGQQSRWATMAYVEALGWTSAVNPALDQSSDEGIV